MAGSIRQRGKNSWQIRVYIGADPISGKLQYATETVSARSRREADREKARLVTEVAQGKHTGTTALTVAELIDRWVSMKESEWAPSTRDRYAIVIKNYIVPALGLTKLAKVTPMALDNFYSRLQRQRVGVPTIRKIHIVLSGAFNQARKWELIASNPARDASPPKVPRPEVHPPDMDTLRTLLSATSDEDFKTLLLFTIATGARRGEVCGLKWGDVDFEHNRVRIRATKTKTVRTVTLDPEMMEMLRAHRARAATIDKKARVFPVSPGVLTRRFARLRKRAGIEGVRLHDFRHLNASQLLDAGVPIAEVAERLGHSQTSTTLNVYTHTTGKHDERSAKVMGNIVRDATKDPVVDMKRSPRPN